MFIISKEFHFSASHVLGTLPSWHPCARLHGHNYVVVLELSAEDHALAPPGFVRDYRDLDGFKKWVDATLDHRHLNEAMVGEGAMGGGVRRQPRTSPSGSTTPGTRTCLNSAP